MSLYLIGKYALIAILFFGLFIIYMKWSSLKKEKAAEELIVSLLEKNVYMNLDMTPYSPEELNG